MAMIRRSRLGRRDEAHLGNAGPSRWRRIAGALVAVVAVAACQTTKPAKWVKVAPEESELVYGGPDLRAATTATRQTLSSRHHIGWWVGTGGLPRLGVSYSKLNPDYIYVEDAELSEIVGNWKFFKDEKLNFVGSDRILAEAGLFHVLDFRFKTVLRRYSPDSGLH